MANPNHDPKNSESTLGSEKGSVKNAAQNGINMQKNIGYTARPNRSSSNPAFHTFDVLDTQDGNKVVKSFKATQEADAIDHAYELNKAHIASKKVNDAIRAKVGSKEGGKIVFDSQMRGTKVKPGDTVNINGVMHKVLSQTFNAKTLHVQEVNSKKK